MDMPVNQLKRALREGRPQVGCWLSLASHASAEICAGAGFDWVLVDTEHAPADLPQVHNQLHAIAAYPVSALVRPYWNDTVVLKRLLDIGVQSFVIPYVQSAEEAKRAVAAVRYPPRGVRGVSTNSRANRFGRVKDYFAHADNEICLIVQVETRAALSEIEKTAAIDGIDGLFIGPQDLATWATRATPKCRRQWRTRSNAFARPARRRGSWPLPKQTPSAGSSSARCSSP